MKMEYLIYLHAGASAMSGAPARLKRINREKGDHLWGEKDVRFRGADERVLW